MSTNISQCSCWKLISGFNDRSEETQQSNWVLANNVPLYRVSVSSYFCPRNARFPLTKKGRPFSFAWNLLKSSLWSATTRTHIKGAFSRQEARTSLKGALITTFNLWTISSFVLCEALSSLGIWYQYEIPHLLPHTSHPTPRHWEFCYNSLFRHSSLIIN